MKWYGTTLHEHKWEEYAKCLSILMDGRAEVTGRKRDDDFFIMINGDSSPHNFTIPHPAPDKRWLRIIDTSLSPGRDIVSEDEAKEISSYHSYKVHERSIVVLISKPISLLKIRQALYGAR